MSPPPVHPAGILPGQPRDRFIDTIGLGFSLWFLGYIASIILYFFVAPGILGWVLFVVFTPVMVAVTHVRFRKRSLHFRYYMIIAVVWTSIAVVFDFLFIVLLFNPGNYYHLDVLVYYLETFLVPVIMGILYRPGT
jgi:hypothetical protein